MPRNRHSYRRRSEDSSDDNEDDGRHDRFRSERYPERNRDAKRRNKDRDSHRDQKRHRKRRSRSRSPHYRSRSPYYRSRSPHSRSRSLKKEHRNSSSSEVKLKKRVESVSKKSNVESDSSTVSAKSKQKTNLSDLLKRFDESTKKTESTHESDNGCSSSNTVSSKSFSNNNRDLSPNNKIPVGPVLPTLLKKPLLDDRKEEEFQQGSELSIDGDVICNTLCETTSEVGLLPIGPALPPHLKKSSSDDKTEEQRIKSIDIGVLDNQSSQNNISEAVFTSVGPALPPNLQNSVSEQNLKLECQSSDTAIGPALPPHLQNSSKKQAGDNNEDSFGTSEKNEPEYYGPSLPPSLIKDVKKVIGPALPPDCKMEIENEEEKCGEDDEDFVGPVPEDSKERSSIVQQKLDLRAMEIKIKLLEGENESSEINKRENWMLELPPQKATSLGLGPRTFRTREGPDMGDRSCWTDTPADKLQKLMKEGEDVVKSGKDELHKAAVSERDRAMEELTSERSAEKPLSLLEIHQQNMRKKKMKEEQEGKKPERRPFDRNIDLHVNRFDEAQRKAIYKKAQLLDSRFSQGESKYL